MIDKYISNIDKLKKVVTTRQQTINKMLDDITRRHQEDLLYMNRADQLYNSGQLSDGSYLPPYSPTTVMWKHSPDNKGDARTGNMTLRDSGSFTNSFKLQIDSNGYIFYSTDWKSSMLVARYGEEIFGLTDQNLQKAIDRMYKPELIEKFKERLKNGLSSVR